jgi:PAS domain S-box-containing protein
MTKYRILAAEDDSVTAKYIQKNLNRLGYDVVSVVSSGEKAVRDAEILYPDLVLMDIGLKGKMNGIEAADKIHALGIPVIFITACSDNNTFERAKHTVPYGYIIKPLDLQLLHLNIDMALIRHSTEKALVERSRLAELAEEARIKSEEKYKNLVELTSDIIYIHDIDGNQVYLNDAGYERLKYSPEEIIGKPWLNVVHPEDREFSLLKIKEMIDAGVDVFSFENRYLSKSSSEINMLHNVRILRDEMGEISGIQGIARDITENNKTEEELRKHREHLLELVEERTFELKTAIQLLTQEINFRKSTEETLKESKTIFKRLSQEFHTLLDAIPDTLLLLSPDLKVLWSNRAAASVFEKEASALNGRHCYELWHQTSGPCEDCHVIRCFSTGEPESSKRTVHNKRLLDSRAFPIIGDDNNVQNVILVVTDITEKTNLEAEAVRAAHLASLGELAAGVAHEINNPINGIINYAQIIANKSEKRSKENDIAGRIIKEGNRIAVIVSSLLSFARERKEEKATVRVEKILHDAITLTEVQIRKEGINLKMNLSSGLPEIIANPQHIQQVFLNIISNARYALNKKYPGPHEEKTIEISDKQLMIEGCPYLRLIFYDQGTGIPANIIDKLLNPFFSTKPSGEGTGLGLSISHGIIKDHGGSLQIESMEAEFTKIIIDLPVKGRDGR